MNKQSSAHSAPIVGLRTASVQSASASTYAGARSELRALLEQRAIALLRSENPNPREVKMMIGLVQKFDDLEYRARKLELSRQRLELQAAASARRQAAAAERARIAELRSAAAKAKVPATTQTVSAKPLAPSVEQPQNIVTLAQAKCAGSATVHSGPIHLPAKMAVG